MEEFNRVFSRIERNVYALRALYGEYGFKKYRMSKFEEYDLYVKNKDFLVSDNVITFTDTDGKLMALKPDVTLSIIKNGNGGVGGVQKVYYNENVYRVSKGTNSFKEFMQVGLECFGDIGDNEITEVVMLAVKSLATVSNDYVLDLSHLGLVKSVMDACNVTDGGKKEIFAYLGEKNAQGIALVCAREGVSAKNTEILKNLVSVYGSAEKVLPKLDGFNLNEKTDQAIKQLNKTVSALTKLNLSDKIRIDFSVVNDMNYYNGIVFKGFVSGIPASVLSGGQYDNLMEKMGKKARAIGFAVYLDELERLDGEKAKEVNAEKNSGEKTILNVALPKGRLGEKVYAMFEKAGFDCPSIKENNRKLIFENQDVGVRYFWVKPSDVAIYVERGAADIGVAGKDILDEYKPDVYELLDMKMGKCDMCVAAKADFVDDRSKTLVVATKFAKIAKAYYASQGRDIDIIHLNGSIEIAPILGLSDVIVDIVETGTTLKENNLVVVEKFLPISARLISNKANFKFKNDLIEKLMASLAEQTEEV
ncbi:MAG: ATP phosphoribosyltransferase [Clostridia bacterium]|nr:ATP phosphoribosyltransferase [Clostridia bacterium]